MPRNPDTLCAGGCGRLLLSGTGSRPEGERICRGCRRLRRQREVAEGRPAVCAGCGEGFTSRPYPGTYRWRTVCSDACGRARMSEGITELNRRRAERSVVNPAAAERTSVRA